MVPHAPSRHGPPPGLADATRRLRGFVLQPKTALAILLLILVAFGLIGQAPPVPVRDEWSFLSGADRLLAGFYADTAADASPRRYLWHGPGLPLLLAPLAALDLPLQIMRVVLGSLLLWVALLVFYRLLRRDLSQRAAVMATYALAAYVPFYPLLRQLQKEPLAILLVTVALLTLTRGIATGRRGELAAAGAALAGLVMVRLEYGWVLTAMLALALAWSLVGRAKPQARRLAACAAIGLALCAPWLVYTHSLTGKPLYWSSSSGLSLYWMSATAPGLTGEWHSPRTVRLDPEFARHKPLFERVARLAPVEQDVALRDAAMRNIRGDPVRYARNVAANTSRLLYGVPSTAPQPPLQTAGLIVLNTLLLAALAWSALRLRRHRRAIPAEVVAVALLAACSIGVHLWVSASSRMLMPVIPMLVWLLVQARLLDRATAMTLRRGTS